MLAFALILFGAAARFLPHVPNVQPVAAIALFAAVHLPNKRSALIVPLALMILTDLFLGLHDLVGFTWGSVLLIGIAGLRLKKHPKTTAVLAGSLVSAVLFFIVTNFGVWLNGWYAPTLAGLKECYVLALPFFRNFLASTLVYSTVLFGAYEGVARSVRRTKWAPVLLTV